MVIVCPHCDSEVRATRGQVGSPAICPKCGKPIIVTAPKHDNAFIAETKESEPVPPEKLSGIDVLDVRKELKLLSYIAAIGAGLVVIQWMIEVLDLLKEIAANR